MSELLRLTQVGGPLNGRHLVALALPPFISCQLPGPKPRRTVIYRPTGETDDLGRHIYEYEEAPVAPELEPEAPLPPARWQLRLANGDLIAGDYEWMDGGTDPDPDRIDWDPVEGYLDEGVAVEAWWMVPTKVVAAPLPQPEEDEAA